jgi:hypothetical protein
MTQEELNELKEKVQKAKKTSEVAEVNYRLLREEFETANTAFILSNASSFPYKIGDKIKYTRKNRNQGYILTEESIMIIDKLKARTNSSEAWIDILCYPIDRPNYETISIAVDLNGNILWDDTITIENIKEE